VARGLALPRERLIERPYKIVEGQIGLRALIASPKRPTAIICGNDVLAFGALLEAQHLGIAVPEEMSIAGFDDLEFSAQIKPALTTIRVGR
jgi:LacI family transcriptional regulator